MSREMNDATLSALLQALTEMSAAKAATTIETTATTTTETTATATTVTTETATPTKSQKRCSCCTKKLTLADLGCPKCKARVCGAHRLPELHACPHDFRKEGAAQLEKANPRVVADKLDRL